MSNARHRSARHARKAPGRPAATSSFGTDIVASLVVFLVALPLCIGVAAASGVPVALGIISGIIGGLVVGFLPGSSLQVSGPAAGLAALVLEFVGAHGLALLGPVVLVSGLIQMALGALRMGRLFQSISLAVVQGMLAGIGLPLILSQGYALTDSKQLGSAVKNIAGLPDLLTAVLAEPHKRAALVLGALSLALCFLWKKVPAPLGKVPAPLVAVLLGSVIASLPGFDVKRVEVGNLLGAVHFAGPGEFAALADPEVITMVITFAVIASAESLFSAAAVDKMHDGPRTQYNAELFSQGVGNTLCGLLGSLPMTAVIARSSANVQAGARTKVSRILHGGWLLGFGLLLPGLLGLIPVTVLAGILVHAGWKLFDPPAFPKMWKTDRGEGIVMIITTLAIMVANLLEGVVAGLAVAIVLVALRMSRITIHKTSHSGTVRLELHGNATFLRLPRLIEALESITNERRIQVDLTRVQHLDLACRSQVEEWAQQRRKAGAEEVQVLLPGAEPHTDAPLRHSEQVADTAEFEVPIPRPRRPQAVRPPAAPGRYDHAGIPEHGYAAQVPVHVQQHAAPPHYYPYSHGIAPEAAYWTPEDDRAAQAHWEGNQR